MGPPTNRGEPVTRGKATQYLTGKNGATRKKLKIILPTIWTDGEAEVGRVRAEKRREEKRRQEQRRAEKRREEKRREEKRREEGNKSENRQNQKKENADRQ